MKKIVACIILAGILSCAKTGSDIDEFNGNYVGYFHKSGQDTSLVNINFSSSEFGGNSSKKNYPAIGSGAFSQSVSTIEFRDISSGHNSKDTSYVLNGIYNYDLNDDGTIRIWKKNGNTIHEFILKRPIR